MTTATAPNWTHCASGAGPGDPIGCRGVTLPGASGCLVHADPADRTAYLDSLAPGADVDLRGTVIGSADLRALLNACKDPDSGYAVLGRAQFDDAEFTADTWFSGVTFTWTAWFTRAVFADTAWFESAIFNEGAEFGFATFAKDARFRGATFTGSAHFEQTTIAEDARFDPTVFTAEARFDSMAVSGDMRFESATFTSKAWFRYIVCAGDAWFDAAIFSGDADFQLASFGDQAHFDSATFARAAKFPWVMCLGEAHFDSVTFEGLQHLGPLICGAALVLDAAVFTGAQMVLEACCANLSCERVVFTGTASLRLRYAEVTLSGTVLRAPLALQAVPTPFEWVGTGDAESPMSDRNLDPAVRLRRLDGVDAANLVLTDIDLSDCAFTGAFHLDQIQLGFGCTFRQPPAPWHFRGQRHWSRRKALAEEHHWRALDDRYAGRGWEHGPHHPDALRTPGPDDLTQIYQQLRKAFEDAGDEPDAADFYYGEMEMRRHDPTRPRGERGLLWLYWLVSGYGLRASRALSWLLVAMASTVLLLLLLGLPDADPAPQTSGVDRSGRVQLVTTTPDPHLSLPLPRRFSIARTDHAALVVINSVVFRSSGQNLTTPGTAIEMLSRIGEPVLLALAALAVRGRVKR